MAALTNEEIEACREAFVKFDRDGTGVIDSSELRATLLAMGQKPPTDDELFDMIAELDSDGSGAIGARGEAPRDLAELDALACSSPARASVRVGALPPPASDFSQFLKMMTSQKAKRLAAIDETDTIDAFVALGGNADKTGVIAADRLRRFVRDFGLSVNIEKLISDADVDKAGFFDYDEFRSLSWS